MNNLLTMKPTFLEDAELLLLGIGDDDELKKYLAADYKFDDKEIKKGVKSFEKARDADADFEETVGDQAKEKAAFEELFEQAEAWVEKHSECLQIAMEDCFQSHFIHFFVQQSPFMPLSEWFTRYTEMYYRILSDRSVMAEMTLIGRNQKEFEKGLNSVLNAMEAWEKLEPKDKKALVLFTNTLKKRAKKTSF